MRNSLFIMHSIGALISSMLLYYAFDVDCNGWFLAVASFVLLLGTIEETSSKASMFLCESLFVIVFLTLQYSFLIRMALDDVASLLVIMIVVAMYILPFNRLVDGGCKVGDPFSVLSELNPKKVDWAGISDSYYLPCGDFPLSIEVKNGVITRIEYDFRIE